MCTWEMQVVCLCTARKHSTTFTDVTRRNKKVKKSQRPLKCIRSKESYKKTYLIFKH